MQLRRTYIYSLLATGFMAGYGAPALADDRAEFLKLMADPDVQKHVMEAAKHSTAMRINPCPAAEFNIQRQYSVYQPAIFDRDAHILSGAWKQVVAESGCGENRLLNVFLMVDNKEHMLKVFPVLPGTTHADPLLQKDSMIYVAMASVQPEDKECKTQYVSDTEFLKEAGKPMEGVKTPPWDELWTMSICTKKAQVTMHFIPDKTGTTIRASMQETKFIK